MKYPMINKQPRREVNIPALSGGLNLRDSLSRINDNQMTDCLNMWYKDGALCTRPPISTDLNLLNVIKCADDQAPSDYETAWSHFHTQVRCVYNSENCILASNRLLKGSQTVIYFGFQSAQRFYELPSITAQGDINYFVAESCGVLYCYLSDCSIKRLEYTKTGATWKTVAEEDITAPVVMAHCKPENHSYSYSGTQINGYNLIGRRYKMIYSTVNFEDDEHHMWYPLRWNLPLGSNCNVTAKLTNKNGVTVEHKVLWDGKADTINTEDDSKDGYYMFVGRNYIAFSKEKGSTQWVQLSKEAAEKDFRTEDNLEITAFYECSADDKQKVFNMTKATWFGGAAMGINGGTRLFLGGNTADSKKALVVWSALNDPLYFPENNYFYVGNQRQAVTAFGKQGENLVIFKTNETYYTYYAQNTDITADNLISQSVVDFQANSVYFPLVLINGAIGCDCPDTVQLCRNRLVFANSDGNVYTLVSLSQYNEHSIYTVSDMISAKLKTDTAALKTATSCDFDGKYILYVKNHAFVMDYNSYGYQYVSSYSKSQDSNMHIPWYYWDLSCIDSKSRSNKQVLSTDICCIDGKLAIHTFNFSSPSFKLINPLGDKYPVYAVRVCYIMDSRDSDVCDTVYRENASSTNLQQHLQKSDIESMVQTKFFDFSAPNYTKNIDRVSLNIACIDECGIAVKFITNCGEENDTVNAHKNTVCKTLYPSVRAVTRFGIRLACRGRICIEGINLLYRLLGGVR